MAKSPTRSRSISIGLSWRCSSAKIRPLFFEHVNGILVPGGFGQRGSEGKIRAAQFARERQVPYFGICFGMQMAVIEAARNLCGIEDANSTEFGATPHPVVGLMTEWMKGNERLMRGGGDDLGAPCGLAPIRPCSSAAAG